MANLGRGRRGRSRERRPDGNVAGGGAAWCVFGRYVAPPAEHPSASYRSRPKRGAERAVAERAIASNLVTGGPE
jgi:hypothetical protein